MKFKALVRQIISCCLLVVPLISALPAFGQQGTVSVTISTTILNDGKTTGMWTGDGRTEEYGVATLFLFSGGKSRELAVPFGTLSAPFRYVGPSLLQFYKRPLSPDPKDPLPEVMSSVQLPAGASEVLLVFVTEDFASQRFRIIPLDISPDAAPNNSIRIINFTGFPVLWNLDGESGQLTSGSAILVETGDKRGYHRLQFASLSSKTNSWRIRYNRRINIVPNRRFDMILIPSGADNNLSVRVLRDFVNYRRNLAAKEDRELPIREALPDQPVTIRPPRMDRDFPEPDDTEE